MSDRALRRASAVLAVLGAVNAGYLALTRFTDTELVCATGGCGTVQDSRYAELAGVPVAVLGLATFAAILVLVAVDSQRARAAAAALALAALAFSGYLLVLQLFVIDAVCTWCVVNDVLAAGLAATTVARLRSSAPGA